MLYSMLYDIALYCTILSDLMLQIVVIHNRLYYSRNYDSMSHDVTLWRGILFYHVMS